MRTLLALVFCILMPWTAGALAAGTDDAVFSDLERRIIEDYFGQKALSAEEARAHGYELYGDDDFDDGGFGKGKAKGKHRGLPLGLAKRDSLPPGLARRGQLPPGLAKQALPEALLGRLPPPPAGAERVIVDDDVVLIDEATGLVLDILYGVANR